MLIPFKEMFPRQGIDDVTGIMHVGAHLAEELEAYTELGIHNVVWVEANPRIYEQLCNIIPPPQTAIEAVVSDKSGEVVSFNVANNGQSSSILELGTHEQEHPDVEFTGKFEATTTTLTKIFWTLGLDLGDLGAKACMSPIDQINMLNLDIQGAELKALEGMDGWNLKQIKYIYTEVNEKELYKGCALLPDLDAFLGERDFTRVETEMTRHGWGDALFVRGD